MFYFMSTRKMVIIFSIVNFVWFLVANLIANLAFTLLTGKDPVFAALDSGTKQLAGTISIIGTIISIIFAIILAVLVTKDCKENTGRKPLLNGLLALLLGFIWGFIYLLLTLNQQGKVQKKF